MLSKGLNLQEKLNEKLFFTAIIHTTTLLALLQEKSDEANKDHYKNFVDSGNKALIEIQSLTKCCR